MPLSPLLLAFKRCVSNFTRYVEIHCDVSVLKMSALESIDETCVSSIRKQSAYDVTTSWVFDFLFPLSVLSPKRISQLTMFMGTIRILVHT